MRTSVFVQSRATLLGARKANPLPQCPMKVRPLRCTWQLHTRYSIWARASARDQAGACADLPAVVLPPMWMGLSEHHFPFGGTISLDYATFAGVLRCVMRSLLADGFSRLMLFNSHGGNIEPLAVASREMAHEFGVPVLTTSLTKVAPKEIAAALTAQPGIHHACEGETSLWLHLDPSQVRMDQIANSVSPGNFDASGQAVTRFWSFSERAPVTGVRGDARAATAEKGKVIFEAMAEGLARELRDTSLWAKPDPVWSPGRAQGPR